MNNAIADMDRIEYYKYIKETIMLDNILSFVDFILRQIPDDKIRSKIIADLKSYYFEYANDIDEYIQIYKMIMRGMDKQ